MIVSWSMFSGRGEEERGKPGMIPRRENPITVKGDSAVEGWSVVELRWSVRESCAG